MLEHKSHNIATAEEPVRPDARTPERFTGLKVGPPAKRSVGLPAVWSGLKHAGQWMRPGAALKTMFRLNQKGGIDCPGCAWPDPDDERSALGEYCENGMKAIAEEATKFTLKADFFRQHSVAEIASWTDYDIGKKGRLTEPMLLRPGATHYEPIDWDAAFDLVASELAALDSPDRAVFYTSGRTSNEAAFLYQLLVRLFGTNNLPDCSNMCHESSGKGLTETIGIGKGTVTLEDLHHADLIVVMGQNPGTNHPRMLSALEKCKENGGRIIAVNPLPEAGLLHFVNPQSPGKMLRGGTPLADLFLQVRINGDVALLQALMLDLLERERAAPGTVFDLDFIRDKTTGFETLIAHLEQQNFEKLAEASGVEAPLIREAARMIAERPNMIVCWAMGLTQHKNAVDNVREIVNLLLLRGSIGKPGAGACPVRGHSNVQGDRTMGIWEAPKPEFLDQLGRVFGFEPPRAHGYDTVHAIQAMREGKVGVFFALGGNFLSATPDTDFTAAALRRCGLTVHVSTKLNRSHLVTGRQALILPCLGRTEIDRQASGAQFVSVENSMGVVHSSQGVLSPCAPKLKSEVAIVTGLAKALGVKGRGRKVEGGGWKVEGGGRKVEGGGRKVEGGGWKVEGGGSAAYEALSNIDWAVLAGDYDRIRDLIEQCIPGFEHYNDRVRQPGGFYLPNGPREQHFPTADGKAHFTVNEVSDIQLNAGEYLMMTIRSHDQFNTTIYGLDDRYRGIYHERRVVLMHEKDLADAGLKPFDTVDLISEYKGVRREARRFIAVPFDIPRHCVATYFPEANTLVPVDEFARKSNTPVSKSVVIRLESAPARCSRTGSDTKAIAGTPNKAVPAVATKVF
jgi:molybdopterin-dependent oxidoreductase alpha subunit